MAKSDKPAVIDFERAMGEIESLVQKMEMGEFSLEESIKQFERGMRLTRDCQRALVEAEQRISKLTVQDGVEVLQEFEPPAEG